jgi:protease-4
MNNFIKTIGVFLILLAFTVMSAMFLGAFYSGESGNVALIPITGEIVTEGGLLTSAAKSDTIVKFIEDANANPEIKAILFEIDSPGGTIVATREIANALKEVNKTTVCWLRETAASGAYWVASNCDKIVADPYTITGSIGVSGSYLEFSGLFEKYGINYTRIVSGEQKDIASSYREPTKEELKVLQGIVDTVKQEFISEVSTNRHLSAEQTSQLQNAGIFLGKDAKNIGLVDVLGGKKEAADLIKNMTNVTEITYKEYKEEISFSELAAGFFGQSMAKQLFAESSFKLH